MQSNNKKKICIVMRSFSLGGLQKSSANLSYLLDALGHEIHVVTIESDIQYEIKGTIYDLGKKVNSKNLLVKKIKKLIHLNHYLKQNKFDLVIDNRTRVLAYREIIVRFYLYRRFSVIYMIHSFNEFLCFTKYDFLNKLMYKNQLMVTVSEAAREKYEAKYKLKNILTIHNYIDFNLIDAKAKEVDSSKDEKYILFYGRLDEKSKNLKFLIRSYFNSNLPAKNIKLYILGDGEDLLMLKDYASNFDNHKQMLVFKKFTSNPYPLVKKALFTVLTSNYEGFPLTLLESLYLETPVVSIDFNSGPREVIINEFNGLLVENYNEKDYIAALNKLAFDTDLLMHCKNNAKKSVMTFSVENISEKWKYLLKKIL